MVLLVEHDPQFQVHVMTSHDKQTPLRHFWSEHRRLPEHLVCYRYNAGLRIEDPGDLILLYYNKATRWECSLHKAREVGRPCMDVGGSWTFLPKEEFARRQQRTEEFLRQRGSGVPGLEDGS